MEKFYEEAEKWAERFMTQYPDELKPYTLCMKLYFETEQKEKFFEVLDKLRIHIPVCGMVKDDNHRTRGVYFNNVEIPIDTSGEGFHLVTRIQDEAHRFAIEFHRQLRGKGQVHSVLDDIEGIGPARRKALMRHYLSLDAIRSATVEELAQLPSMNEKAAESVYQFFHD